MDTTQRSEPMPEMPKTLVDAVDYFSDGETCEAYLRGLRWPGGRPICPRCGSKRIGEIRTRRLPRCKDCRKPFSHRVGTILEDSRLGLDKWFVAVWAVANCRKRITSHKLSRVINVTQRTAWFMLCRIRKAVELADRAKAEPRQMQFKWSEDSISGRGE